MKCDLHVHTHHSGMCTVPVLKRICRESYNDPRELYTTLKRRGMNFVTDGEKLRIIAANLIANAIEFSHAGGCVEVRTEMQENALILAVKDQGIGIQESDRGRVFERFRQLDTGPMRNHPGQGLGLSVVKALVEFLDGWITVASAPGEGSLFTCSLPLANAEGLSDNAGLGGNLFFFTDGEEK